jgi:hypothetical protein
VRRETAAAWLLTVAGPAAAHGGFGGATSLGSGALHLLTSPLSLAALAGLVLVLGARPVPPAWALALLAAAAAAGGAVLAATTPAWVAPACVALLGLLAAAALPLPASAAAVLALLGGAGAGIGAQLDAPLAWKPVAGAAVTLGFALTALLAGYGDLAAWRRAGAVLPLARRILGAWVAAIGLLLGALALFQGKTGL